MDPKSGVGIFLGYSINSMAYQVYNNHIKSMIESTIMVVDDTQHFEVNEEEEEEVTSFEQNGTPNVIDKGIINFSRLEDENS